MAENKSKRKENTGKESKPSTPPPTKDEIVAPTFPLVTKGAKTRKVKQQPISSEEST